MERNQVSKIPMHQGKWTAEEEDYVQCLIKAFKAGVVPIPEGTTLRVFLSSMLNCPAKRISKKFVGTNYNGKQVYIRKREDEVDRKVVADYHKKLRELEQRFVKSLAPIIDFQELAKREERERKASSVPARPPQPSLAVEVASVKPLGSLDGQLPLQKLHASLLLPPAPTNNLTEAMKATSIQRLIEMRALRQELGFRLTAQDTLRQNVFHPANTRPSGTNNDILMAMLRQRLSPTHAPMQTPTQMGPSSDFLLETLKRKFEGKLNDVGAPAPAAKKSRN